MTIKSTYAPPSEEEMLTRLQRVQVAMAEANLDYFVCSDPDNVFWLTNFANFIHERPFIVVVEKRGTIHFVVPKLEIPHVEKRAVGRINLIEYFEFPAPAGESWSDKFQSIFKNNSSIGIEDTSPHYIYQALKGDAKGSDLLERCRYIKTDYELGRIKYSSNIATDKMKRMLKMAKPGMSALTMYSKMNKLTMLQLLVDEPELNALATHMGFIVQPPSLSDDPHNFTNLMDLNLEVGGPHVALVNGVMNGYGTEVERTFFLGHVPEDAKKPYEVMMKARELAYSLCKPGNSMHELDLAVNNLFKQEGYADYLLHRTGHSIGVTGHEGPFLAEGFHEEIKAGMLFTIEPGLYIPKVGGFRHSDTVLVTPTGNENLTPIEDSLESMTLPISKIPKPDLSQYRIPLMRFYARLKGLSAV